MIEHLDSYFKGSGFNFWFRNVLLCLFYACLTMRNHFYILKKLGMKNYCNVTLILQVENSLLNLHYSRAFMSATKLKKANYNHIFLTMPDKNILWRVMYRFQEVKICCVFFFNKDNFKFCRKV